MEYRKCVASFCGATRMPVDFHLSGLPSSPGKVFGTGSCTSGTGPRLATGRRRGPPAGAFEVAVVVGAVTCVLVEGFAAAGEFCARIGAVEIIARPSKLTMRDASFFTG